MSENIETLFVRDLVKAYGDNPNKVRKIVQKYLIEYEAMKNGQMAYIMKMALYYFGLVDERHINRLEVIASDLRMNGFDVEKMNQLCNARANNEISQEDFMKTTANLITNEMLENAERMIKTEGYKYKNKTMLKIGEGLKEHGYIKDEKIFLKSIMRIIPAEPIWIKEKTKSHLVYLIEQIREDGKCPYAEIERNFRVPLKPNNNKGGFKIIDDIIKAATQQIGDQA